MGVLQVNRNNTRRYTPRNIGLDLRVPGSLFCWINQWDYVAILNPGSHSWHQYPYCNLFQSYRVGVAAVAGAKPQGLSKK
jgi:hypothetical protein